MHVSICIKKGLGIAYHLKIISSIMRSDNHRTLFLSFSYLNSQDILYFFLLPAWDKMKTK